ncbi:MAG: ferredoxin family protein [Dehalococcoidia bacterium]
MSTKTVKNGYIEINKELCKGCRICIEFCPAGCISLSDELNAAGYLPASFKDDSNCTGCAICALVCPDVCIEVYRD